MNFSLNWCACRCCSELQHSSLELCHIVYWIGQLTIWVEWKEFTRNCKVVPYASSAAMQWMSSLRAVWMPRSIMGRYSVWCYRLECACRDAFNLQWKCSTIPFAIRWYEVVRVRLEPRRCIELSQSLDSNWLPWSVVMVEGSLNLNSFIHESLGHSLPSDVHYGNGFRLACKSIDAYEGIDESLQWRKQTNDIHMHIIKFSIWSHKCWEWGDCVPTFEHQCWC